MKERKKKAQSRNAIWNYKNILRECIKEMGGEGREKPRKVTKRLLFQTTKKSANRTKAFFFFHFPKFLTRQKNDCPKTKWRPSPLPPKNEAQDY